MNETRTRFVHSALLLSVSFNCGHLLFILQPLLILLAVRLVANGCQAFCLGVVIVKANVELLVKLVDQVLHGLEAHHLREVLQLREVLAGDGRQGDGGGGRAGGGGLGGVGAQHRVVQLIHTARPQIIKLLIQTH